MNITISIVIPVYNVSVYVDRCLLSVMRQTFPATECIIVDDFSTDDSIARCQHLIDEYNGDTRFSIIHHDRNRGLSAARNTGTYAATGDYIFFLDSDDEITPECLEKLVAPIIRDTSIEMVMGDYRWDISLKATKGKGKEGKKKTVSRSINNTPSLICGNKSINDWFYKSKQQRPFVVWNRLLKLSFIKENQLYCKEGQLFEDQLWSFYLMRCLNHAAFVHQVTYIRYYRPDSIMNATNKADKNRHISYIHREISPQLDLLNRPDEAVFGVKHFCRNCYEVLSHLDALSAYNKYLHYFSKAQIFPIVWELKLMRLLSKNNVGNNIYHVVLKCKRVQRTINNQLSRNWNCKKNKKRST